MLINIGLGLAAGEIIGIINSNGWYELEAVARVIRCLTRSILDYSKNYLARKLLSPGSYASLKKIFGKI
ncbi:MAG: hypothetical protein UMV23_03170 [Halanaerobium sp.]|nr:hypothetical protein [Halanaerobium sp.]